MSILAELQQDFPTLTWSILADVQPTKPGETVYQAKRGDWAICFSVSPYEVGKHKQNFKTWVQEQVDNAPHLKG